MQKCAFGNGEGRRGGKGVSLFGMRLSYVVLYVFELMCCVGTGETPGLRSQSLLARSDGLGALGRDASLWGWTKKPLLFQILRSADISL